MWLRNWKITTHHNSHSCRRFTRPLLLRKMRIRRRASVFHSKMISLSRQLEPWKVHLPFSSSQLKISMYLTLTKIYRVQESSVTTWTTMNSCLVVGVQRMKMAKRTRPMARSLKEAQPSLKPKSKFRTDSLKILLQELTGMALSHKTGPRYHKNNRWWFKIRYWTCSQAIMEILLKTASGSLGAVLGKLIHRINEEEIRRSNKMEARGAQTLNLSTLKQLQKQLLQRYQTTSQIPKRVIKVVTTLLSQVWMEVWLLSLWERRIPCRPHRKPKEEKLTQRVLHLRPSPIQVRMMMKRLLRIGL